MNEPQLYVDFNEMIEFNEKGGGQEFDESYFISL